MTPDVIAVKATSNYLIEATFADGEVRRFNMVPYLRFPAFSALQQDELFMRAHICNGTAVWTDEIDLSPDTLYLRGEPITKFADLK